MLIVKLINVKIEIKSLRPHWNNKNSFEKNPNERGKPLRFAQIINTPTQKSKERVLIIPINRISVLPLKKWIIQPAIINNVALFNACIIK